VHINKTIWINNFSTVTIFQHKSLLRLFLRNNWLEFIKIESLSTKMRYKQHVVVHWFSAEMFPFVIFLSRTQQGFVESVHSVQEPHLCLVYFWIGLKNNFFALHLSRTISLLSWATLRSIHCLLSFCYL
jgi:hypothetical protein